MKKLFVCAMALAAFVSCSKDDIQGPALDSKNKSIEITIANGNGGTRAEGGITAAGTNNQSCVVDASKLMVLFTDGTYVLKALNLTAQATADPHPDGGTTDVGQYAPGKVSTPNTYIWHNVPWNVTNIAVVRFEAGDITIAEDGTTKLADVAALATNEPLNLNRSLDQIVLYGVDVDGLQDTGETHRINDIVYHVWHAEVTVAPQFARFEINNFQCDDLGHYNHDYVQAVGEDGKPLFDENGAPVYTENLNLTTYGFDELVVAGLGWSTVQNPATKNAETTVYPYTAKSFTGTLYGDYVPENPKYDFTAGVTPTATADRPNWMKPAQDATTETAEVWSWNILPQTFDDLVVNMTAKAYDYQIATRNVPLNVIDLDGTITDNKFEAGNIYQLDLSFNEVNIIDPEGLCVTVKVNIQPWTVNTVTPVFGKPAAAPAQ